MMTLKIIFQKLLKAMNACVLYPEESGYSKPFGHAFNRDGNFITISDADILYEFERITKTSETIICPHRMIGNPSLTKFLNWFYDVGVTDAQSGFRIISREALETLLN